MLQEFAVDSEVILTSHHKIVRKSRAWRTGSPKVLKRFALISDEFDISWDPGIGPVFSGDDLLGILHVFYSSYLWLQPICHGGQFHLHHHGLDVMHHCYCHDHHLGVIEVMRGDCSVWPGHTCYLLPTAFTGDECFSSRGELMGLLLVAFIVFFLFAFIVVFICFSCLVPHQIWWESYLCRSLLKETQHNE